MSNNLLKNEKLFILIIKCWCGTRARRENLKKVVIWNEIAMQYARAFMHCIMTQKSFLRSIIEYLCKFKWLQNCLLFFLFFSLIFNENFRMHFDFSTKIVLIKTKTKYKCSANCNCRMWILRIYSHCLCVCECVIVMQLLFIAFDFCFTWCTKKGLREKEESKYYTLCCSN